MPAFPARPFRAMRVETRDRFEEKPDRRVPLSNTAACSSRARATPARTDLKSSARDEAIQHVWDKILAVGQPFGIKPCGLGARDTLRTEVCYPLYGHELDENTTPIEAGLGFFVALDKGEFIGRAVLAEQKAKRRRKRNWSRSK